MGLIASFFKQSFYVSGYYNYLKVLTGNDDFASFYNTTNDKSLHFFEINTGGFFPLGRTSSQFIKLDINLIFSNDDTKLVYNSSNTVIPSIKVGIVTRL